MARSLQRLGIAALAGDRSPFPSRCFIACSANCRDTGFHLRLRTGHRLNCRIIAAAMSAALGPAALAANRYWDGGDASAANNNATTGAGLGGPGTWNNLATANWWDGASATDRTWN